MTPDDSTMSLSFIKNVYPGWGALLEKIAEKTFKSSDVQRILGISYRQLSDWERRGMLRSLFERSFGKSAEGWRAFSVADLISLGVLKEAKTRGMPITRLQHVMGSIFFTQEQVNETFPYIVYGLDVLFYTNFVSITSYYCVDKEDTSMALSIEKLRKSRMVVVLPVNGIADSVLMMLNHPDFRVVKKPEGGYHFIINRVPLALEALPGFKGG